MSKSEDNLDIRVLKIASCKSITGKSTLTYHIGCTPDHTVHIRISNNSSTGQFSPEWICIEDIQKALAKGRKEDPLTSFLLEPLLRGKSVNTPAFLMAALTNERLLRVLKGKKRGHEFLDPVGFTARMDNLVASKAKPKGTTSTRKKAVIKKKAMSRRKTSKSG
jgi:hypothetical protein